MISLDTEKPSLEQGGFFIDLSPPPLKMMISRLLIPFFLLLRISTIATAQLALQTFIPNANNVTAIANCGDERLFFLEQPGIIRIADLQGNLLPDTFLNITSRIGTATGERGLLGIAFSPDYALSGYFYLNYTNTAGHTTVSRFRVPTSNPNQADSASEEILLTINQPYSNHNGGDMHFGPDGYLYIASGDGGSAGDPGNRAQNLQSLLGKILRIDVSNTPGYTIPASNPFVNIPNAKPEIWTYGWRNPWRMSFDRLTGDLWVADVGQNLFEEVNMEKAGHQGGSNYGWRCYEANAPYNLNGCASPSNYVFPILELPHGNDCSITGGFVYRGALSASFYGNYFFTDFCSGEIRSLHPNVSGGYAMQSYGSFLPGLFSTFGTDLHGEMYVGRITAGIFKLTDSSCTPAAFIAETDTIITALTTYTFRTPYHPLFSYQWYLNDLPIPGAVQSTLSAIVTGRYYVKVVRNDSCFNTSNEVTLILRKSGGFELLPNPATDEVQMIWGMNFQGDKEIRVYDMSGRCVFSKNLTGYNIQTALDLHTLSQGVYLVRLIHNEQSFSEKLMITRVREK